MISVFVGLGKELKQHGLAVQKVAGWQNRGSTTFAPRGIIFHHTASNAAGGNAPALGIVTHGRSDLPGPLCQFLVGRDGTIFFVAAGRANHAGTGGPIKGIAQDNGNTFTIGVECENNGIGEKWGADQLEAIAILFAILLDRMEASPQMIIGHREWTTRKIDPANIDLNAFRARVGKVDLDPKTEWRLTATHIIKGGGRARDRARQMREKGWKTNLEKVE